jgi:hypothetical protein
MNKGKGLFQALPFFIGKRGIEEERECRMYSSIKGNCRFNFKLPAYFASKSTKAASEKELVPFFLS